MRGDLPIAELVLRYLNREALTPRESERIKIWLSDPANLERLEEQFRDPSWLLRNLKVIGGADEIDHWRKVLAVFKEHGDSLFNTDVDAQVEHGEYEEHKEHKGHEYTRRIGVWKYAAAAAVLFVVVGGGYWALHRRAVPDRSPVAIQTPVVQDLAPGGNKAVLTLGNGSTIILDSVGNGDLAEQGQTRVVKPGDGQLSYQSHESNGKPTAITDVLYNTVTTPAGGQYQVVLPDGSKVWLNAASSLRFPTVFNGPRVVQVSGEAFFEVAKDPSKPFVVESGDKSVAVLGTRFNVNAYGDEPFFAVSLVDGSVRVQEGISRETLHPGEQAQVSSGGIRVDDHVNLRQVTAWKDGLFKFYNSDIQTIMREVARWYDVTIVYEGKIPEDRFTGTMDRSLNASDVLKILALSKVHFRIEGRRIVVMPD